jgi:hypothetical protein
LLITTLGFAVRYITWIYPGLGASSLIIFDVGTYTVFGIQYIENIKALNITALAGINTGVPPLGMVLTGLTASTMGSFIGYVQAGLLAPILASSLTTIPTYMLVKRHSHKAALVAASLIALDPFLVEYSTAFLDSIGTLFAVTSVYYLYKGKRRRDLILAAAFASMASLTKLTFLILFPVLALFLLLGHQHSPKHLAIYVFLPILSLSLNPWLWMQQTIKTTVEGHLTFNNVLLPPVIGPLVIGIPQSLPWYILTYLGLGAVSWNTLPQITQFVLFALLTWKALNRRPAQPCLELTAASAMAVTIFVLPRNYWTYVWAGSIRGEDVLFKQFYPYYFYPVGPFFAILIGALLAQLNGGTKTACSRLITYPVLLASVLSPFALVMNVAFPYWDFLFTLIYSLSLGRWVAEGITATFITIAMLVFAVIFSELIHRRVFCSK